MRRFLRITCAAAVAVLAASPASAQPVAAGIGAFGGATVVDFNATANAVSVGNQYNGLGVTFSGALLGLTNAGDLNQFPGNGGGVVASNWDYSMGSYTGLSFRALFSAPVGSVGFWLENWPTQTGVVEIFSSSVSLGTINFAPTAGIQAEFFGLTSAVAFDELQFTNDTSLNGFYAIDDFQFGASAVTATPEPASVLLMSTGLIGIVGIARRRRSA